MLAAWQRWKDYQLLAIRQSGDCLRQSPGSTTMTVIVIALTMMLPALLWLFSKNIQNVFADWQKTGPISVYIAKSASESDQQALLQRIRTTDGVKEARLVSAIDGLAILQQQTGIQDLMQYLSENPLPAVIHVITSDKINSVEDLQNLYQLIRSYQNVEQATLDLDWINTLYSTINVINNMIRVLMLLLSTVVVLIIGNTLRLAMDRRRDEINVLNLLGASKAYIVRPHIYTGMWYGMSSACLMIVCVDLGMVYLGHILQPLADINVVQNLFLLLSWKDIVILMTVAIFLGFIGAKISINRLFATIFIKEV